MWFRLIKLNTSASSIAILFTCFDHFISLYIQNSNPDPAVSITAITGISLFKDSFYLYIIKKTPLRTESITTTPSQHKDMDF